MALSFRVSVVQVVSCQFFVSICLRAKDNISWLQSIPITRPFAPSIANRGDDGKLQRSLHTRSIFSPSPTDGALSEQLTLPS